MKKDPYEDLGYGVVLLFIIAPFVLLLAVVILPLKGICLIASSSFKLLKRRYRNEKDNHHKAKADCGDVSKL